MGSYLLLLLLQPFSFSSRFESHCLHLSWVLLGLLGTLVNLISVSTSTLFHTFVCCSVYSHSCWSLVWSHSCFCLLCLLISIWLGPIWKKEMCSKPSSWSQLNELASYVVSTIANFWKYIDISSVSYLWFEIFWFVPFPKIFLWYLIRRYNCWENYYQIWKVSF